MLHGSSSSRPGAALPPPSGSQPSGPPPSDSQPSDSQPSDSPPSDSPPSDSQPGDSHPSGPPPSGHPPIGLVLGIAAGVLNLSFLLESLLPGPTRVGATVVSDLAVPGHPWSWLFRAADAGSALCLLALCVVLLRHRPAPGAGSRPGRVAWVAASVATAAFAVSTLVAATVPETCAPATDPSCPSSVAEASTTDLVHDAVSSLGSTAGVLAALVLAVVLRRTRWLAALHGAAFAAAASSGLVFVVWQAQTHDDLSGWAQRVQIVVLSAWFVVLGVTADRGGTAALTGPPARPPTEGVSPAQPPTEGVSKATSSARDRDERMRT